MQISIRKMQEQDIPYKVKWINDNRNNQYLHYELPLEIEKTRTWFQKNKNRKDRFDAVIEADGNPVGVIGLLNIENEEAEYYITIGEQEFKGKGIAKEASIQLLNYAFQTRNLQKVFLYTECKNKSAQGLFERIGFQKAGVEHGKTLNRGKIVDRFYYTLARKDFFKNE